MKKILSLLILLVLLTSCGKGLEIITSPYDLSITEEFLEHFDYNTNDIPKFTLEFEGEINVIANWRKEELIFSNNDDFKVSELISGILNENDYNVLVSETKEMKTTKMNTFEGEKRKTLNLTVDGEIVYNELICVNLDNGLKLTMQFRRFVSEGITYYAWQYTSSLRIILHYPVMVIKQDGVNKLVIITLPDGFSNYTVNFQLGIDDLIEKDKYVYGDYEYSFRYIDVDTTNVEEVSEAINTIKQYYINNYDGIEEEGKIIFSYLGKNFSIDFNEQNFVINYLDD